MILTRKMSKYIFVVEKGSWLWHKRLGHANMDLQNKLSNQEIIVGLTNIEFEKIKFVMLVK